MSHYRDDNYYDRRWHPQEERDRHFPPNFHDGWRNNESLFSYEEDGRFSHSETREEVFHGRHPLYSDFSSGRDHVALHEERFDYSRSPPPMHGQHEQLPSPNPYHGDFQSSGILDPAASKDSVFTRLGQGPPVLDRLGPEYQLSPPPSLPVPLFQTNDPHPIHHHPSQPYLEPPDWVNDMPPLPQLQPFVDSLPTRTPPQQFDRFDHQSCVGIGQERLLPVDNKEHNRFDHLQGEYGMHLAGRPPKEVRDEISLTAVNREYRRQESLDFNRPVVATRRSSPPLRHRSPPTRSRVPYRNRSSPHRDHSPSRQRNRSPSRNSTIPRRRSPPRERSPSRNRSLPPRNRVPTRLRPSPVHRSPQNTRPYSRDWSSPPRHQSPPSLSSSSSSMNKSTLSTTRTKLQAVTDMPLSKQRSRPPVSTASQSHRALYSPNSSRPSPNRSSPSDRYRSTGGVISPLHGHLSSRNVSSSQTRPILSQPYHSRPASRTSHSQNRSARTTVRGISPDNAGVKMNERGIDSLVSNVIGTFSQREREVENRFTDHSHDKESKMVLEGKRQDDGFLQLNSVKEHFEGCNYTQSVETYGNWTHQPQNVADILTSSNHASCDLMSHEFTVESSNDMLLPRENLSTPQINLSPESDSPCSLPGLKIDCPDTSPEPDDTTPGTGNQPLDTPPAAAHFSNNTRDEDLGDGGGSSSQMEVDTTVLPTRLTPQGKSSNEKDGETFPATKETTEPDIVEKKELKTPNFQIDDGNHGNVMEPKHDASKTGKEQQQTVPVLDQERAESPESGEIVSDDDDEKEEGEIEDDSKEENSPDSNSQRDAEEEEKAIDNKLESDLMHALGPSFCRRPYQDSCSFRRSRSQSPHYPERGRRRWYHFRGNKRSRHTHRIPRHDEYESSGRRKRRRSSPPFREDEEKELLMLRNAALETMIVQKVTTTTDSRPVLIPEDEVTREEEEAVPEDQHTVIDMELVTSSDSSANHSRDPTPDISSAVYESVGNTTTKSVPAHSSIKVVTNRNNTWKIESFRIIASDTEDDGEEEETRPPSDISKVIQMYRQVAEAKVSERKSLSSLILELTECENEIEEEGVKLQLLNQQLKLSERKLAGLKERKAVLELKISTEKKSSVPAISVDSPSQLPPSTNDETVSTTKELSMVWAAHTTVSSPDNASVDSEQPTSGIEDISQPPSISHSPTPSFDVDQASDSSDCKSENGSVSTTVSEAKKDPSVAVPTSAKPFLHVPSTKSDSSKKKQLLNLVAARQNNLAQAKSLLAMLEHNQRKRKKSPNPSSQLIGKKKTRENTDSNLVTQSSSKTGSKSTSAPPRTDSQPPALKPQLTDVKTQSGSKTGSKSTSAPPITDPQPMLKPQLTDVKTQSSSKTGSKSTSAPPITDPQPPALKPQLTDVKTQSGSKTGSKSTSAPLITDPQPMLKPQLTDVKTQSGFASESEPSCVEDGSSPESAPNNMQSDSTTPKTTVSESDQSVTAPKEVSKTGSHVHTTETNSRTSCGGELPSVSKLNSVLSNASELLGVESIEESKVKDWFDHMISDMTAIVRLSQPTAALTPVGIAMREFEDNKRDTAEETKQMQADTLTGLLNKVLGSSNNLSLSSPGAGSSSSYASPLLKFRSYRLSPLYRTLFKQQLSSPTYSNTIKHNVIMCHHESQGKCNNKSCKAQHWSDVIMTHDDIISDFTQYLPPEKTSSVQHTLSEMSSKLQKDQVQTMAAHVVYKELSHDDHVTISSQWVENTAPKPTNVSTPQQKNRVALEPPIPAMFENKLTSEPKCERSSFRYFNADSQNNAETTPTTILTDAQKSADDESACATLEKGLEQFPSEETLWLEYLRRKHKLKAESSDTDYDRATSAAPSYTLYYEVIKLTFNKEKWILKAIDHFVALKDGDCSHVILELLLCYSNWCLITRGLEYALKVLNVHFSKEMPEDLVLSKLDSSDKVYLGLTHLHLMHTGALPTTVTGCHGNQVPLRITSKRTFVVPWKKCKIPQDEFDATMALFRRYIKRVTSPECEVSVNVSNCLPLYINLFYFEMSQGNSSTTAVSISKLLEVVPNIRELSTLKASLSCVSDNDLVLNGADPLVYYVLARKKLVEGGGGDDANGVVVSLLKQCVRQYFDLSDHNGEFDTFMLYRKMLRQHIPYDLKFPPLASGIDPPGHTSLLLNYCLLVELTTPALSDEVYESALHHDIVLWLQYISLLSYRVRNTPSVAHLKQLIDISQRFSLAVNPTHIYANPLSSQEVSYTDYSPHNQMLDILLGTVSSYEDKVKLLKQVPMHQNPHWIYRFFEFSESDEEVRSVLPNYLSKHPSNLDLWLIGIRIEMRLGNFRQARWMFSTAALNLPYSSRLWTQFLLFELAGIVKQYSNLTLLQSIINKLSVYGVEFKSLVLNPIES